MVCQSRTQETSWSTALILNTLSRVTELKEITESFSCEFWHDSRQTFPHLNSQERLIRKGRAQRGTRAWSLPHLGPPPQPPSQLHFWPRPSQVLFPAWTQSWDHLCLLPRAFLEPFPLLAWWLLLLGHLLRPTSSESLRRGLLQSQAPSSALLRDRPPLLTLQLQWVF